MGRSLPMQICNEGRTAEFSLFPASLIKWNTLKTRVAGNVQVNHSQTLNSGRGVGGKGNMQRSKCALFKLQASFDSLLPHLLSSLWLASGPLLKAVDCNSRDSWESPTGCRCTGQHVWDM